MKGFFKKFDLLSPIKNAVGKRVAEGLLNNANMQAVVPLSEELLGAFRYPFLQIPEARAKDFHKLFQKVAGKVSGLEYSRHVDLLKDERLPSEVRVQFIYQMPEVEIDASLLEFLVDKNISQYVRSEMALHIVRTPLTPEIVTFVNCVTDTSADKKIMRHLLWRLKAETKASCKRLHDPDMQKAAFFGFAGDYRNHPLTLLLRKEFSDDMGDNVTYPEALDVIIRPIYEDVIGALVAEGELVTFSPDEIEVAGAMLRRSQSASMGHELERGLREAGINLDKNYLSLYVRLGHTVNWPHIADVFVRVSGFTAKDNFLNYFSGFRILPIYQGVFPHLGISQMQDVPMEMLNIRGNIFDGLTSHSPVDYFSHSGDKSTHPVIGSRGMNLNFGKGDVRFPLELDLEREYDVHLRRQDARYACNRQELNEMLREIIKAQVLALVMLNKNIKKYLNSEYEN